MTLESHINMDDLKQGVERLDIYTPVPRSNWWEQNLKHRILAHDAREDSVVILPKEEVQKSHKFQWHR